MSNPYERDLAELMSVKEGLKKAAKTNWEKLFNLSDKEFDKRLDKMSPTELRIAMSWAHGFISRVSEVV